MSRKHKKIADVALLAVFFSLTLLVNFFHTEKTLEGRQACPACHFQHSSIATQVIPYLFVPRIDFIQLVKASFVVSYEHPFSIDLSPRGPPQA